MSKLIDFLQQHLEHSTLRDALEKDGLNTLLAGAKDELAALTQRVDALEGRHEAPFQQSPVTPAPDTDQQSV